MSWTRATTFAKTISDMYGLGQWQQRMVAHGLTMRHDLYALAAATKVDDKKKLDQICDDAKEAAAASSGANLGTALHAFTEQIDAGEQPLVPEPWAADVAAYRTAIHDARITMHPEWIERVVIVPELQVAGTLDRIVTLNDGRNVIADVKTGKSLDWSWGEIAIQLAIYANATHMWDPAGGYQPMPAVDQDIAVVIHLPVGKATCDLYEVDIAAGSKGAFLCARVREWRSGARKLAAPYVSAPAVSALDMLIAAAPSREVIEGLWQLNIADWTPAHTEAAKARIAALQALAGTTGETPGNEQAKENTA